MADKIVGREVNPNPNSGVPIRLKDMSDGTFAEVVYASGSGGGGGGGAVTMASGAVASGAYVAGSLADGAIATLGTEADAAASSDTATASAMSYFKRFCARLTSLIALLPVSLGQKNMAGSLSIAIASDQGAVPVSGTVSTTAPTDIFVAATNITAQNTNPNSGTATANSTVSVTLTGGQNCVTANISANALGAVVTAQVTVDGTNWVAVSQNTTYSGSSPLVSYVSTITSGTTGQYQWFGLAGCKGFRLSANTATVSGTLTATLNASIAPGSQVVTMSLQQLGAAAPATMTQTGGSAAVALGVFAAAATTTVDYNSVAWAATSGSGATIADSAGAVCSFDVNLSTFTAGSSTGLDIFLQWSPDGGTTWYDLWQCEALTAAGHVYIPPLLIPGGRRRMRWVNRTGAATTATVTVTANRLSVAPAKVQRQWFDRTAGVLSGTTSSVTAWYDVAGCTSIAAFVPLGTASGPAQYQIQLSADGVNVLPGGAASAATASTTTAYVATAGLVARFARLAVTTAATSQSAATTPVVITGC